MDYSKLFDSHTHYHDKMDEGQHFVLSGFSHKSNGEVLQKISELKNAYFSLGLGPQEIQREDLYPNLFESISQVVKQVESQKENKKFVAIGEVGLDSHWGKTPAQKDRQFETFEKMIGLAKHISKPLVIHSRDSERECITQLLAADCKKVAMHCFGGKLEDAKRAVDAGFYISIPPVKNKERKKIITQIDLDYLLVESDAPYLGKKSVDAKISAQMICEYKNISIEQALEATFENARNFFCI